VSRLGWAGVHFRQPKSYRSESNSVRVRLAAKTAKFLSFAYAWAEI
jgi:hypothetical protein